MNNKTPTAPTLLDAIEYIVNAGHPDAQLHMPELRGLTDYEVSNLLVRKAQEALDAFRGGSPQV